MLKTINSKPLNKITIDPKPDNKLALNRKPNNKRLTITDQVYTDTRVVAKGEVMLLVPLITFPSAGTYSNAVRI